MITVDTLQILLHNQIPVITTELLAQLYGTEAIRIQQNHSRNTERFVEGKHFYKLAGDELREMKHRLSLSESVKIARNVRSLILWTERGAARHAKMLETDRTLLIHFDEHGNIEFTEKVPANAMVCTLERFKFYLEQRGWIVARKEKLIERLMQF
ncbi:ORF6N domain-containing protein [Citrobacter portucalensis]|uniref:ORF6N domain-containing protein n=1 Tax=Citrobacter portucalensis TaxID=1639133 RepID=UPI00351D6BB6